MAKRNKKATRKIERLRDRLHHADENPDFKVGWITQYMFVMDNFDIGETKRANENRWLYTIGPQRRTRYPFETLVIPGTHYTLHWFMQCKISDPSQVPEFKYVPISTGATSLPFGTAPYVPTVQISQTKSDWVVVPQEPFIYDAKAIIQCMAKCINQHNFTIFDARDLMQTLSLKLPLISHEETICELEFLERQRKGIVINYQNRYKRKASPVKVEESAAKRPRLDVPISSLTRMLLDHLSSNSAISIPQAAEQFNVKEKVVEQVVDVLSVVGQVSLNGDLITTSSSTMGACSSLPSSLSVPTSPKSPISSCDDSYGPIPETPPQAMPMWESSKQSTDSTSTTSAPSSESSTPTSPSSPTRPYATRSSTMLRKKEEQKRKQTSYPPRSTTPVFPVQPLPSISSQLPLFQIPPLQQAGSPLYSPPPTQPVRPVKADPEDLWSQSHFDFSFPSARIPNATNQNTNNHNNTNTTTVTPTGSDKLAGHNKNKLTQSEICFETNLDLMDSSIVDFFQSSFWDQY